MCLIHYFNKLIMTSKIFILLGLYIILTNGLSCMQQYECQSVTVDYNYAGCYAGECKCIIELGFSGNATTLSKCDCLPPSSVYWLNNLPYCLNYIESVNFKLANTRNELLKNKIITLYNQILWPSAAVLAQQIATHSLTGELFQLFDTNVEGVIDPLGKVNGFEGTAEYFIGSVWTGLTRVTSLYFSHLVAENNKVSINIDIHFGRYDNTTTSVFFDLYNLTQTGIFTFNDDNKIQKMNLVIRNLGLTVNSFNQNTLETIQNICQTILFGAKCNATFDPLGYYTDMNDCVNYLSTIEYGSWDNVRQNTTVCRAYHRLLAILRPHVHCPHVGKTGGNMCITYTADDLYLEQF